MAASFTLWAADFFRGSRSSSVPNALARRRSASSHNDSYFQGRVRSITVDERIVPKERPSLPVRFPIGAEQLEFPLATWGGGELVFQGSFELRGADRPANSNRSLRAISAGQPHASARGTQRPRIPKIRYANPFLRLRFHISRHDPVRPLFAHSSFAARRAGPLFLTAHVGLDRFDML